MRSGFRRAPAVFIAAVILVLCAGMAQAAQLVGDGNLLKREPGELCSACHRTNYNTVPPGETGFDRNIWNNAIKMHSSEVLGSCNPSTYETMSACLSHGGQWTPSKAASWPNGCSRTDYNARHGRRPEMQEIATSFPWTSNSCSYHTEPCSPMRLEVFHDSFRRPPQCSP